MKIIVSIGDLISLVIIGIAFVFLVSVFVYSKIKQVIKRIKKNKN